MRNVLALVLLIFSTPAVTAPVNYQQTNAAELLKTSDEMLEAAAKLRGLQPKDQVHKGVKDREEIAQYLNERIESEYSGGEIEKQGRILQKLGLIPAAMDYKAFVVKLLTEQVGGYYDPEKKTFFIASWLSADEQKPVMIHELTHALQDQHFEIWKILKTDRSLKNDDIILAHQAVMEGDGMVVMLQYLLEPARRHFSEVPDLATILQAQMASMQLQYPVFKEAPAYLKDILLFPYGYGASFLQYAWRQKPSWDFINKIYSDLPSSTEQIMHPEKYFGERDLPKPVHMEEFAAKLGPTWKISERNVLGEFTLGTLMSLHLTEERSRRAATGWGGDQVILMENEKGKDVVLAETVWDTVEDAEKFFNAMDEWFRLRYPKAARSALPQDGFAVVWNGELYSMRRDGMRVRLVFGLPEAESTRLKEF